MKTTTLSTAILVESTEPYQLLKLEWMFAKIAWRLSQPEERKKMQWSKTETKNIDHKNNSETGILQGRARQQRKTQGHLSDYNQNRHARESGFSQKNSQQ